MTRVLNDYAYLTQFADLLAQTSDTRESRSSRILKTHLVHHRVYFTGKDAHDSQSCHVETNTDSWLEFCQRQCWAEGDDVSRTRGCFDDNWGNQIQSLSRNIDRLCYAHRSSSSCFSTSPMICPTD